MDKFNINDEAINNLLSKNGSGISSNDVKKAMQSGNTERLVNSLSKEDKQRLNNLLNDEDAMRRALESPQAKALMKLFNKN